MCDPKFHDRYRRIGEDPEALPSFYAHMINECVKNRIAEELGKNLDPFDLICHIALSLSTGNRSPDVSAPKMSRSRALATEY